MGGGDKLKICVTKDEQLKEKIRKALADNEGYCPCKLEKIPENKCICEEFLNGGLGPCHCGLYTKEEI